MTITDVSVLPPAVREYYDRFLLMTAYPTLIHATFAQKRNIPRKSGDTIVMRRFNRLDTVPIPLVDGVSPPPVALSHNDIKARVDWYGKSVRLLMRLHGYWLKTLVRLSMKFVVTSWHLQVLLFKLAMVLTAILQVK